MRQRVPHPATPRELLRVLKIPRDERTGFKRNLRGLVNDGSLIQIKGDRYGLPDRMDLVVGKLDGHPSGFGFVTPEKPIEGLTRDIYVPEHALQEAMHGDRVVVRIERYREDGRAEGRIVQVLERAAIHGGRPLRGRSLRSRLRRAVRQAPDRRHPDSRATRPGTPSRVRWSPSK